MKTVAQQSLYVRVQGWSNDRQIVVEDDRILMEIARTANGCHHCPTCRRRVDMIEQTLNGTPLVWKWEFLPQGGMFLAIPRNDGKDAIEVLRKATGLNIYSRGSDQPMLIKTGQ